MLTYTLNNSALRKLSMAKHYRSTQELAQASGLHRNTIQQLLSGKPVFIVALRKLAAHFAVDPLELVEAHSSTAQHIEHIDELSAILAHLEKSDPQLAVVLIGSRATGKHHRYADWDIGITCHPTPIDNTTYMRLKNDVADLADDLPRKVDLINLDHAPPWFLESITCTPLHLTGNEMSYTHLLGVLDGIQRRQTQTSG